MSDKKKSDLDSILGAMKAKAPPPEEKKSGIDDALASLRGAAPAEKKDDDSDVAGILGSLKGKAPEEVKDTGADDVLSGLAAKAPTEAAAADSSADVLAGLAKNAPSETPEDDGSSDVLAGLAANAPEEVSTENASAGVLAGFAAAAPQTEEKPNSDSILDGIERVAEAAEEGNVDEVLSAIEAVADAVEDAGLDDVLSGIATDAPEADDADDGLDDVLAGLSEAAPKEAEADDLDSVLAGLSDDSDEADDSDDLDDVLAGLSDAADEAPETDDLDDVLAGLTDDTADADESDDLDDVLAGLGDDAPEEAVSEAVDEVAEETDDLDGLLDDLEEPAAAADPEPEQAAEPAPEFDPQEPFGIMPVPRPDRSALHRPKFRMALFGDFTGRASKGLVETGEALAKRRAIKLDVDTIEDIIEGFGTTLTLPIGKDGMGVEVKLKELDDLHPDELYENVEIFEALQGLRQQLSVGSMAAKASEQLAAWGEAHGTPISLPKRSASTSVPPDRKLSDFQALIGDTRPREAQKTPAEEMIARIVGPYAVKAPDAGAASMLEAVDKALSHAMRMVLHHPDFQAVEAQWRSLDMLARRIETDAKLQIVLYDVSAEEMAADLAANEDLSQSGLFQLLTEAADESTAEGGFSALFGLYTFEETPPHAELLARIAQVVAHVDAPFFTSMTPNYLDTKIEDRHPLVAKAWDDLRALPEAAYLGLTSPRFLLRLPYGAKTEPCYEFEFEEFTPQEGLSGMLWANPVIMVAVLLAASYKKNGKAMDLGSIMSMGDMPFHYVTDRYGDQVALPCTERNLTSAPAQHTVMRGYMPVLWVKGGTEVRLGSFQGLSGEQIAGPWSAEVPAPRPRPGETANVEVTLEAGDDAPEDADADSDVDDLLADLDLDGSDDDTDTDLDLGTDDDSDSGDDDLDMSELDDLLAGFEDDGDDDDTSLDDDEMDPELAALLEGL